MTRILKPVAVDSVEYLHQICARYFMDEHGFRIAEYNLGNNFTGSIDILATDGNTIYLVIINRSDFVDSLFRSFMGYTWFKENREFLCRMFPPEEIDLVAPVTLIILSQDFPPETHSMLGEVCKIPVQLYRYRLLGSREDPDVFIERIGQSVARMKEGDPDLDALRKELGIEIAHLTDEEILEFRAAMNT